MSKLAIFLFDYSGVMAEPWHRAGYDVLCVDWQHPAGLRQVRRGFYTMRADLRKPFLHPSALPDGFSVAFVAAFPPCTHLAVSGARWFKGKGLRALQESVACFATAAEFCEASGAPYLIENPVSTISTYWRKPDYTFHPHEFTVLAPEDNYTKKTCLWVGGGFVMPQPCPDGQTVDDRIHKAAPGPEREAFRSQTPRGFAEAVFLANGERLGVVA